MAAHQPLGIGEITFAPFRPLVGLRLGQMEWKIFFQTLPDRLPVLRGRLHDGFTHSLSGEPVPELFQIGLGCAELATLKAELTAGRGVGDYDRQHSLVDVYTSYFVVFHLDPPDPRRGTYKGKYYAPFRVFAIAAYRQPLSALALFKKYVPDQTGPRSQHLHCRPDLDQLRSIRDRRAPLCSGFHGCSWREAPSRTGPKPRPTTLNLWRGQNSRPRASSPKTASSKSTTAAISTRSAMPAGNSVRSRASVRTTAVRWGREPCSVEW